MATVRHTYTHFKLRMEVFLCRWISGRVNLRGPADFKWLAPSRIIGLPLHGAMHKALKALPE
jgi:A/G-specific adenine glycosylase